MYSRKYSSPFFTVYIRDLVFRVSSLLPSSFLSVSSFPLYIFPCPIIFYSSSSFFLSSSFTLFYPLSPFFFIFLSSFMFCLSFLSIFSPLFFLPSLFRHIVISPPFSPFSTMLSSFLSRLSFLSIFSPLFHAHSLSPPLFL